NPIRFLFRLQLARSVNHRSASINPNHPLRAALDEDPAEAALAASTVEDGEIADVATGCQHGLVQEAITRRHSSFSGLLDPGGGEPHPLLPEFGFSYGHSTI